MGIRTFSLKLSASLILALPILVSVVAKPARAAETSGLLPLQKLKKFTVDVTGAYDHFHDDELKQKLPALVQKIFAGIAGPNPSGIRISYNLKPLGSGPYHWFFVFSGKGLTKAQKPEKEMEYLCLGLATKDLGDGTATCSKAVDPLAKDKNPGDF